MLLKLPPAEVARKIKEFFEGGHMDVFQRDLSKDRFCDAPGEHAYTQDRSLDHGATLIIGGHQWCMSKELRTELGNIITPLIAGRTDFANFEDIFELMRQNISAISGVGPLALYDISLRIAWLTNEVGKRAIMPHDYVYLQSGALNGAIEIFDENDLLKESEIIYDSNGKQNGGYRIKRHKLAKIFQHDPISGFAEYWDPNDLTIPAWIIEDILCVMFHNSSNKSPNGSSQANNCRGC